MKKFAYTLILSILMSASYYNDVCAEEYTADTADCFSFNNKTSKSKVYKFFCFDKKTGYGITGTYKQIVDGVLDSDIPFKDGNRDGTQIWYYKSGKVKSKNNYKDGKEYGISTYYRETGEVEHTEEFKEGKLNGHVIFYTKAGKVEASAVYKDGKRI